MKKIAKTIVEQFGYELRRKPAGQAAQGNREAAGGIEQYIDMTQGMTSIDEATLLYRLAKELKQGCIVEVGSYRGRSTVALGRGSLDGHNAPVYAVEPHEEFTGILGGQFGPEDRAAFYRAMLDSSCYQTVRLINLSSEVVAPNWSKPIGLLWIDGDHSYEGVKRDYECWAPHLLPDAHVAFDDSLDPQIGPHRLIAELLQSQPYQITEQVGKITVLRRSAR